MKYRMYDRINGHPVTAERAETMLTQLMAEWPRGEGPRASFVDVVCNHCGGAHPWDPNSGGEYCHKCDSPDVSFDIQVSDEHQQWRPERAKEWWEDTKHRGWMVPEKKYGMWEWDRPTEPLPPWEGGTDWEKLRKQMIEGWKKGDKKKKKRKARPKPATAPKPDAPVIRRKIRWQ